MHIQLKPGAVKVCRSKEAVKNYYTKIEMALITWISMSHHCGIAVWQK